MTGLVAPLSRSNGCWLVSVPSDVLIEKRLE